MTTREVELAVGGILSVRVHVPLSDADELFCGKAVVMTMYQKMNELLSESHVRVYAVLLPGSEYSTECCGLCADDDAPHALNPSTTGVAKITATTSLEKLGMFTSIRV